VKFIGPNGGRCLKLFSWEEVRPLHGITPTILVSAITERFHFQFKPALPVPPDTVVKLADGSIEINGALIPIQKFDIYTDGFAVECAQTDDAKLVSDEIVSWAQTDLGYRDFVRPPKIVYQSQVVVEFVPEFENLFKAWKIIQGILNESVQNRYGFSQDVDVYRVQWRGDAHTIVNNMLVSDFWIERKAAEPHSSNRWVCTAPLPMIDWLAMLEVIENLALSN
jgi:hypothetical protein